MIMRLFPVKGSANTARKWAPECVCRTLRKPRTSVRDGLRLGLIQTVFWDYRISQNVLGVLRDIGPKLMRFNLLREI